MIQNITPDQPLLIILTNNYNYNGWEVISG